MKITAIKSQTNKSDILELKGNELTINKLTVLLDDLPKYPVEENADIQAFLDANQCYTDLQGVIQLKIYVSQEHFFLFVNNNYLLFHDTDLNGEIDIDELADLIRCYNLTEEKRKAEHKKYRDSFSTEDWKIRMETCNPKR